MSRSTRKDVSLIGRGTLEQVLSKRSDMWTERRKEFSRARFHL